MKKRLLESLLYRTEMPFMATFFLVDKAKKCSSGLSGLTISCPCCLFFHFVGRGRGKKGKRNINFQKHKKTFEILFELESFLNRFGPRCLGN